MSPLVGAPMRRRRAIAAAVAFAAAGVFALAVRTYLERKREAEEAPFVLPQFKEPAAGPRAPRTDAFDVVVGKTPLAEVETEMARRNLACKDTSPRALMAAMRAERAKNAGVDAVSTASAKKKSAMEKNPQVRLSCEDTHSSLLRDRARPPSTGRLLYVFDSSAHPLRHVSFRRMHRDQVRALDDVREALRAMKERFGPPTSITGALPSMPEGPVEDHTVIFPRYVPFKAEWAWPDFEVTVSALSYGPRGVDVYEAAEVPWPVRSDAPAIKTE